jgi:hypothetical protein
MNSHGTLKQNIHLQGVFYYDVWLVDFGFSPGQSADRPGFFFVIW